MKVLVIGGTGLISVGIVKHLLARGAEVSVYNRGKRPSALPASVEQITGDRSDSEAFGALGRRGFDAVIDMIGFSPAHAEATIATFSGRAEQLLFCSTCCVYGVDIPSDVVIDETYTPKPTSNYGKDKLRQEQLYQEAASKGAFQATIIRPSCTYGPGASSSISSSSTHRRGVASSAASRSSAAATGSASGRRLIATTWGSSSPIRC